jgi:hypothetical protein
MMSLNLGSVLPDAILTSVLYYYGDNPTEIARNYLNDYNSRTYTETLTNFERTVTNKVVNSNGDVSFIRRVRA